MEKSPSDEEKEESDDSEYVQLPGGQREFGPCDLWVF